MMSQAVLTGLKLMVNKHQSRTVEVIHELLRAAPV